MGLLVVAALFLSSAGCAFVYILLFLLGANSSNRHIRQVHNWLIAYPLKLVFQTLVKFAGAPFANKCADVLLYLFGLNSPLAQILYLILIVGGYLAFILGGFDIFEDNTRVGSYHRWLSLGYVSSCLIFYVYLCQSDPGFITEKDTAEKLCTKVFQPDDYMFLKDNNCDTCHFNKPARSKHCSYCDGCIMKFDHHCVWLRNCIGLFNWRWFLLFCVMHISLCIYGVVAMTQAVLGELEQRRIWQAIFTVNGVRKHADHWLILNYVMINYPVLVGLTAMCATMGLSLTVFTGFHFWLHFWKCSTTNELARYPRRKAQEQDKARISWNDRWNSVYQDLLPLRWMAAAAAAQGTESVSPAEHTNKKVIRRRRGSPELGVVSDAPITTRSGKQLK